MLNLLARSCVCLHFNKLFVFVKHRIKYLRSEVAPTLNRSPLFLTRNAIKNPSFGLFGVVQTYYRAVSQSKENLVQLSMPLYSHNGIVANVLVADLLTSYSVERNQLSHSFTFDRLSPCNNNFVIRTKATLDFLNITFQVFPTVEWLFQTSYIP